MAGLQSGELNDIIIIPSSTYNTLWCHHAFFPASHLTYFAYSELVSVEEKEASETRFRQKRWIFFYLSLSQFWTDLMKGLTVWYLAGPPCKMMSAKYAEMTINKQLFSICTFLAQRCFCRVIGSGKNDPNYSIPVTPDKTLRIPNISLEKGL